jgi:hypothetical protein
MRKVIPHLIIPLSILFSSLFAYFVLSDALSSLVTSPDQIAKFELAIQSQPERASNCAFQHWLNSIQHRNLAITSFQSALKHFLVGGMFGIFMLSLARELYVYKKLHKSS